MPATKKNKTMVATNYKYCKEEKESIRNRMHEYANFLF